MLLLKTDVFLMQASDFANQAVDLAANELIAVATPDAGLLLHFYWFLCVLLCFFAELCLASYILQLMQCSWLVLNRQLNPTF